MTSASAVDPATLLYRARASREHDLSAPTRSRTAPDLAASRGGAPDDLPPRKFTRARQKRRRGDQSPQNLPGRPAFLCSLSPSKQAYFNSLGALLGREISSPGAAVIARPRSIPTSLGRPVEPCGAPAHRWRTTPATSAGGRIFTDMVERHPVAGLGVAPAPPLLTRGCCRSAQATSGPP